MKAKISRKLAALLTAAALTGSIAAPMGVWAADTQTGKTDLNAEVDSTYKLTIPAQTTLTFGAASTKLDGVLKVSGNVDVDEKVTVTATSNALKNASHKVELPYTLMNGQAAFTTANWSETELREGLEGDGKGKELQLSVAITKDAWEAAKAGSYAGSITFTAELN
ncbi:MAG: hypothetical protein Q4C91_23945 [Eubacteriales bacterium]|nr:hypothetical protein [Eubacteriales bacterium]